MICILFFELINYLKYDLFVKKKLNINNKYYISKYNFCLIKKFYVFNLYGNNIFKIYSFFIERIYLYVLNNFIIIYLFLEEYFYIFFYIYII